MITRRKTGYTAGTANHRVALTPAVTIPAMLILGISLCISAAERTISLLESEATIIINMRTGDLISLNKRCTSHCYNSYQVNGWDGDMDFYATGKVIVGAYIRHDNRKE